MTFEAQMAEAFGGQCAHHVETSRLALQVKDPHVQQNIDALVEEAYRLARLSAHFGRIALGQPTVIESMEDDDEDLYCDDCGFDVRDCQCEEMSSDQDPSR